MIRKFETKDLQRVMELWINTNIQAHDFISKDHWINHYDMVKEILPTAQVYVYEEENVIQGFIGVMNAYIAGIFINRTHQSKGIGKQLLDFMKTKHKKLTLAVYEKNTLAVKFYKREDFEIINKAIDENTGEMELHMVWEKKWKVYVE